jgi:hypothetical protein
MLSLWTAYFWFRQSSETAEQTLKKALGCAPILAYQQPRERFVFDTNASNVGIGRVLSQVQDGQERVIAYYSKPLNKDESNYSAIRRDLLVIVRTLEYFRKYFCGHEFHLCTDYPALTERKWKVRRWKPLPSNS